MSGNVWMFSDQIDDEDMDFMRHEFVTYSMASDYYGLGLKLITGDSTWKISDSDPKIVPLLWLKIPLTE